MANSAWLVLAAIAFNLTRAAGALASAFNAKATAGTIRRRVINITARVTPSALRLLPPGPGPLPGSGCSPPRSDRQLLPERPSAARPEPEDQWSSRADRQLNRGPTHDCQKQDQLIAQSNPVLTQPSDVRFVVDKCQP